MTTSTPMEVAVELNLYLLCAINFDMDGNPVRLHGVAGKFGDEFRFVVAKTLPTDFILPDGDTGMIAAPFKIVGITLNNLAVSGTLSPRDGRYHFDGSVMAVVTFPKIADTSLTLSGALMLEDGAPRMVAIALKADRPLGLDQVLSAIFGWDHGAADWLTSLAGAFAFSGGNLYYLRPGKSYTCRFPWEQTVSTFEPGYRVEGLFRVFGRYDFGVRVSVTQDETRVETISRTRVDLDFIALDEMALTILINKKEKTVKLGTRVSLFNSVAGTIEAGYDVTKSQFTGTLTPDLGVLPLPIKSETKQVHTRLTIGFAWSRGVGGKAGLRITSIGGLPTDAIDLATGMLKVLNDLSKFPGGCSQIVAKWLESLATATLSIGLDGFPSKREDGYLLVPLKLTYSMSVLGKSTYSADFSFSLTVVMPSSLGQLPVKLLESVGRSSLSICKAALKNEETYKVVAIEAMKRGGARAAARFICRALYQFAPTVAEALVAEALVLVAVSIGAALELALVLILVAVFGITSAIFAIKALIDFVESLFSSDAKKKEKERQAEEEIKKAIEQFAEARKYIEDNIRRLRDCILPDSLRVGYDGKGGVTATVSWRRQYVQEDQHDAPSLRYTIEYCGGTAGTKGPALLTRDFTAMPLVMPLDALGTADYRMNARIMTTVTAGSILREQDRQSFRETMSRLESVKVPSAKTLRDRMSDFLHEIEGYEKDGIQSDWVQSTSDAPDCLTIGGSWLGVNSRLPSTA